MHATRVWIGIGISVVVVGALGGAFLLEKQRLSPERVVADYLSLVTAGHVEDALALTSGVPDGADARLLTDDAYAAATNRMNDFVVGAVTYTRGHASVSVTIRQSTTTTTQSIELSRVGSELGLLDVWSLDEVSTGSITVSIAGPDAQDIAINGSDVGQIAAFTEDKDGTSLLAFPGDYEVASTTANAYYDVAPVTATVTALSADAPDDDSGAALTTELNEQGQALAQAAVTAHLEGCMAQTVLRPVGCSFNPGTTPGEEYSNFVWAQQSPPTTEIAEWRGLGWEVRSADDGHYTLDADIAGNPDYDQGTWTWDDFDIRGQITSIRDGVAVFQVSGATA